MDRQDIDALLIGALYGELTPADEARLAAHLESHPTDRGALDDLKSARAAVRDSRIFELQVEPPQAVSALLLQEAHRRAPKRLASEARDEKDSWFFRFTRMFMAHPAMAAAAMLVLVVGAFGVVQMRKGDHVAEQTYAPSSATQSAEQIAQKESGALAAPEPPAAGSAAVARADESVEEAGEADNQQGYAVQLDDTRGRRAEAKDSWRASDREQQAAQPARQQDSAKKSKGILVTTPEPQPKDLDAPRKVPASKSATVDKGDYAAADDHALALGTGSTPSGAAPESRPGTGATAGPRDANSSVPRAGASNDAAGSRAGAAGGGSPPSEGAGGVVQRAQNAPAPAQAAPSAPPSPPPSVASAPATTPRPTATKEAQKTADAKPESAAPAKDNTLVAWAKGEHSRTVTLANKGDCIAAAKAAVAVQNRAPDYYAQFMATDRALKKCQAYIAQERDAEAERSGKSRSQKRVTSDAPAATSK